MTPPIPAVREQLASIISHLPEQATWEDVLYEIYVCQSIERGLADAAAGRLTPASEVKEYLRQRGEQRAGSLE